MKIDAALAVTREPGNQAPTQVSSLDFAAALKQATTRKAPAAATPSVDFAAAERAEARQRRAEAARAAHAAAANDLRDYLNKTPAEHLRDAVLKEMGLTEEKLQAMPPEQREAMEAAINRRIRERLLGKEDGPQAAAYGTGAPGLAVALAATAPAA